MRKHIGNIENGIALVLADADVDNFSVLLDDNAVEGKRNSDPLEFLDTAVIMRLEERHAAFFIKRILL